MTILDQLSSQTGDRSEASNQLVAGQCLENPALLDDIAAGLESQDARLLGDCAEVMTMVAQERPERIAPYAETLAGLLGHKKARVRWESMHALALIAAYADPVIEPLLPTLRQHIHTDKSVITRDYAVVAIGNYAGVGAREAGQAYPILIEALTVWAGKHAKLALNGLANVVAHTPALAPEIRDRAKPFLDAPKKVVQQAARRLLKRLPAPHQPSGRPPKNKR